MRANIFDRLSFLSLFLVVVLLPVFVLPFTSIPVEISKGLLLVLGLGFCVIFWAIARFFDGKIVFPKSWLLVSGFGIALVFLVSALFSSASSQVSLFGTMFDIGSFWFIFSGFVLMLCSSVVFRTPKQARIVLLGVILSSAVVLIFQTAHLFMPKILSLGILISRDTSAVKTLNILGSWKALGLFAGFASLLFLLVIEFFSISKIEKIILRILMLISLFLVASVNFPLVWVLLGISSLVIFVYKTSITLHKGEEEEGKKHFPYLSLVVVLVSLLFFLNPVVPTSTPTPLGNVIPNLLKVSNLEAGPSLGATMWVTKEVLEKDPIFGLGPNKFSNAWALHRPESMNNNTFWNVDFSAGFGLLPTLVSTTGGLGILAFIVFLVLFLVVGVRSVFSGIKDGVNWEMMAFFVLSLYLFVSSFFYFTGVVIFLLSLAFAGVFAGLVASNSNSEISVSFLSDHRKSFFYILLLILVVVFSIATSFKYLGRLSSVSYFNKALFAETIPVAEDAINKALYLYSNDVYLRTYSEVYLLKLNSIASKGANLSDEDKASLQDSYNKAIGGAERATLYDPSNYSNFQALGSVYQTAGSLGGEGAYDQAVLAFQKASNLNPIHPRLKLILAGVSFANGKIQDAKNYAKEALTLRPNYIDALVTLSQIAKNEGNNSAALSYGQQALVLNPSDESLIKYVNSLSGSSSTPTPTSSTPDNKSKQ